MEEMSTPGRSGHTPPSGEAPANRSKIRRQYGPKLRGATGPGMTRIGFTFRALHSKSGGTEAHRTTNTCVPCGTKCRISTPSQANSHGHTCTGDDGSRAPGPLHQEHMTLTMSTFLIAGECSYA